MSTDDESARENVKSINGLSDAMFSDENLK
jgi:hypothetical protein